MNANLEKLDEQGKCSKCGLWRDWGGNMGECLAEKDFGWEDYECPLNLKELVTAETVQE